MSLLKTIWLIVLIISSTFSQQNYISGTELIGQKNFLFANFLTAKNPATKTPSPQILSSVGSNVAGIILPHHLLVASFIDKFYHQLAEKNSYETIFLISPNHFDYGYHFIQTTDQQDLNQSNLNVEENIKKNLQLNLDQKIIKELADQYSVYIEPKYYPREHGITVHIQYLNKYFPRAKIIPIIIKNGTPQNKLDALVKKITSLKTKKTLILASIDFTHYTAENFALQNDKRTIQWLENLKTSKSTAQELYQETLTLEKSFDYFNPDSVAIDSPGSLYAFASLMKSLETLNFTLLTRTSTASLTGITKAEQNTSHIFATFN